MMLKGAKSLIVLAAVGVEALPLALAVAAAHLVVPSPEVERALAEAVVAPAQE